MSGPGAAWYPDPHDHTGLRWWDGDRWTGHTHTGASSRPAATAVDTIVETRASPQVDVRPVVPSSSGRIAAPRPKLEPLAPATQPGRLLPPSDVVVVTARRGRWKIHRAGAVLLAILLIGGGAYAAGLLNRLTVAGPTREASSATVKVIEASGYSYEVPNFWRTEPVDDTGFDHGYSVLDQSIVGIGATRVTRSVDLTDPTVRTFLFDTASRAFQLELGDVPPTSVAPFTVDGVEGQQVVFSRTGGDGQPFEASQTVFLHGRRILTVTIVTHGFLVDSGKTKAEFDALFASFRFD